jgi:hypothetical protein
LAVWNPPVRPFRRLDSLTPFPLSAPADLPTGAEYRFGPRLPIRGWCYLLRHPFAQTFSRRCRNILPCCPSPTPVIPGLGLGPTNPGRIILPQETLGFRCSGFSPELLLLMPTSSLPFRPARLTADLQPRMERSPTTHRTLMICASVVSAANLSPVDFQRKSAKLRRV